MPVFEYQCECGKITEKLEPKAGQRRKCQCGRMAKRKFSICTPITDTSFCMTGVRDSRLDNEVIEGRKHWKRKLKEKGYMELSQSHINNY